VVNVFEAVAFVACLEFHGSFGVGGSALFAWDGFEAQSCGLLAPVAG
jgi:hypothetical protein